MTQRQPPRPPLRFSPKVELHGVPAEFVALSPTKGDFRRI